MMCVQNITQTVGDYRLRNVLCIGDVIPIPYFCPTCLFLRWML